MPVDVEKIGGYRTTISYLVGNVLEALKTKLEKCRLVHKWEYKLVCNEYANEVQGLRAHIEELTHFVTVNNGQQDLPNGDIMNVGYKFMGHEYALLTNLGAIIVFMHIGFIFD